MDKALTVFAILSMAFVAGCDEAGPKPTGVITETVFVEDGKPSLKRDFERKLENGWEIISSRRAYDESAGRGDEIWGTEYALKKTVYGWETMVIFYPEGGIPDLSVLENVDLSEWEMYKTAEADGGHDYHYRRPAERTP